MKWFLGALAAVLSTTAISGDFYAGVSAGQSKASFSNDFTAPGVTVAADHRAASALKVFGGYEISSYLAIEGGFTRLGEPHLTTHDAASGADVQRKFAAHSWNIAGKATLPLANDVSAFAKLGLTRNSVKRYSDSATLLEFTSSRKDVLYGAGLGYALTKNFSLRLEYERYGSFGSDPASNSNATGRLKFSLWSFGLEYHLR
jgi:OOP family OmpA-OmpF porin